MLPATLEGAGRSFWVAVLCLPIFLVLDPSFAASPRAAAAELAGYITGWPAYALAALAVCRSMGREALWPRLVAAWNWTNLLQYLIMLIITLFAVSPLPAWVQEVVSVAGIGYALWLQWFTAKCTLQVGGMAALGFVVLDLVVSLLLSGVVTDLSRS
ncbi:hypothetical protein QMO56_16285 [Roseomonas sp. E05]|uniref:hypothetical protein n=1 Tax=Roseomonas sp. E05 TaxID=3046310 RepID=UPI0024BBDCFC|nr:hypothetical protein [Roseomonas sp. E05]MDJ0389674.1 hypothetical protein [Roseomonas sp. E05]